MVMFFVRNSVSSTSTSRVSSSLVMVDLLYRSDGTRIKLSSAKKRAGIANAIDRIQMKLSEMTTPNLERCPLAKDWTGRTMAMNRSRLRAVRVKTETPTEVSLLNYF